MALSREQKKVNKRTIEIRQENNRRRWLRVVMLRWRTIDCSERTIGGGIFGGYILLRAETCLCPSVAQWLFY